MSLNLSERGLFYALLLFWFAGLVMVAVQHPYNCKFFTTLPSGSGTTTPDNPHEDLRPNWWFHFTHRLTLTAYVLLCCFLQLLLFSGWYLQMAAHSYLEDRREREAERGRRMREYGFWRCLRSILRDSDDEIEVLPEDATRCECVCGCCFCFSTACSLWFLNGAIMLTIIYLLCLGYGSLEAASRFDQRIECRRGLVSGIYIFVLNVALLVLYLILALMRCLCSERGVVQHAIGAAKELRARVQTRKGRNGHGAAGSKGRGGGGRNPTYAQLDHAALDAELGLELSDDEDESGNGGGGGGQHNGHGHGHHGGGTDDHEDLDYDLQMELDDAQNLSGSHHARAHAGEELADDLFEDEAEDEVFAAHTVVVPSAGPSRATAASLQQPKPQRPAGSSSSSAAARLDMHDEDTREMLEMLGPSGSGSGSGGAATAAGLVSPSEQRRHQARAEAALDELETQADMP